MECKIKVFLLLSLLLGLMCSCGDEGGNNIDGDRAVPVIDAADMVITLNPAGEEKVIDVLPRSWGFYAEWVSGSMPWSVHRVQLPSDEVAYSVVPMPDLDRDKIFKCPLDSKSQYASDHPEVNEGISPEWDHWRDMEVKQEFAFADFTFDISCYRYIKISVGPNDTGIERCAYVYADFSGLCFNNGIEIHQPPM